METLLSLSVSLLAGLILSRLVKKVNLPAVTAYLIAGILVGPYVLGLLKIEGLGFISEENVEQFKIVCDVALGFIAFSIGNEFRLEQLKHIGKQATIVGIFQAVLTTLLVDIVLIGLSFALPDNVLSLQNAIILGAIASATAPAATLMVVKQYKAKGPLTDILLPVVALDDAVGLVLFAISFGVANAMGAGAISVTSVVVEPLLEIVLSLALGAGLGWLFSFMEQFFHSRSKRLSVSVAFVLLAIALSQLKFPIFGVHIGFSSLLTCMMLGTIFCNICDFSEELMDRLDRWTAPLYILFFVISGAELKLSVFTNIAYVAIGLVYVLSRACGKYSGAYTSAKFSGCDKNIVKYLGITLLPQAGVALGMANMANSELVLNITLFAVLIYEIFGPMLTRNALLAAGDINPEGKRSARDEHAEKMAQQKQKQP